MSTEPDNAPLNDAALEDVNGGYDVLDGLARLGHSIESSTLAGHKLGTDADNQMAAAGGAFLGIIYGTLNGLKNEIGTGVNEAIGGVKNLMK